MAINILKTKKKIIDDLKEQIPELVNNDYSFRIIPLHSKKNTVINLVFNKKPTKFPKEFAIKIFRTKNIVTEINILKRLNNQKLNVPKLLLVKVPYLILEKIEGVNLSDFINDNLKKTKKLEDLNSTVKTQIISSIELLAVWLAKLHQKNIVMKRRSEELFVLNKGDTRLRDFIIDPSREILYGVDFEDTFEGNHLDDIAWICCSLLDTNPGIFELGNPKQKIELINIFLKKYYQKTSSFEFDFNYLAEKIIEDLNIVIKRRGIPFGLLSKSHFMDYISKEI